MTIMDTHAPSYQLIDCDGSTLQGAASLLCLDSSRAASGSRIRVIDHSIDFIGGMREVLTCAGCSLESLTRTPRRSQDAASN